MALSPTPHCAHWFADSGGGFFQMKTRLECWRCAFRNRSMLRRSLITSAVVGTVLVAINQGNAIIGGDAGLDLAWKVPLTYCVPFLVASWGALSNAYTRGG